MICSGWKKVDTVQGDPILSVSNPNIFSILKTEKERNVHILDAETAFLPLRINKILK